VSLIIFTCTVERVSGERVAGAPYTEECSGQGILEANTFLRARRIMTLAKHPSSRFGTSREISWDWFKKI